MDNSIIKGLNKAIDYMEENLLEDIVLQEVAQQAYVSQASFYAIFSKRFDSY